MIGILLGVALCWLSCASLASAQIGHDPDRMIGTLQGVVTMGPTMPVERRGAPPAVAPIAGARIDVATPTGKRIATVKTDAGGNYSVQLAPGSYLVTTTPPFRMLGRNAPKLLTVTDGAVTRLDITLDTGIR